MTAALTLMSLAACNDGEGAASTYIRAQVAGQYWSGPASEGELVYPAEFPRGPGFMYSIATHPIAGGKEFLALGLPTTPATGNYLLDGLAAFATFSACPDQDLPDCVYWKQVPGDPGTLTITRIDPTTGLVEGTFSATVYLLGDSTKVSKSITQGQFSIIAPGVFILE